MNEDLHKLELEVEAALASLSADLSVEPAEALIHRVKAAVRHELNEAWLGGQPSPSPSTKVLQRVRAAVRDELRRSDERVSVEAEVARRPARRLVRSPVWWSLTAAAAMIGIWVGIVHYAGTLEPASLSVAPDTEARLDLFVEVAEQVLADLDALEESITEPIWEYETGVLSDIVSEIDELLAEPESSQNLSRRHTALRGAFG